LLCSSSCTRNDREMEYLSILTEHLPEKRYGLYSTLLHRIGSAWIFISQVSVNLSDRCDWRSTARRCSNARCLFISSPSLGVYYCQQLTLSVCLSQTSNCFLFFLMESSHFLAVSSPWPLYKTLFDFWFRPPNAQNLLAKICTKSPISRLVWQIDRICRAYQGVFGDGRFNGTIQNVVGPTLVAVATKFWLGAEIHSPTGLSVQRSVCHICRPCWNG